MYIELGLLCFYVKYYWPYSTPHCQLFIDLKVASFTKAHGTVDPSKGNMVSSN